ncbi:MAG: FAD-dependent oxidoreductase, partial [Bacteroidales bacterium]
MKHLIIGGVAGGATTAARIRRNDENAEIIMFEKGSYISYANCGLPYYIGDVIKDRTKLFVQTPESFGTRFNMKIRINSEVIDIDPEIQQVTVRNEKGEEYTENYDKLLLSPGAYPVKPPLPGIDSEGIFTMRNVDDTDRIKEYVQSHPIRRAVVVGAGFIGLEMAENLHATGAQVAIVEMAEQVMAPIDFSMAGMVHQHLYQKNVALHLNQAVKGFVPLNGPDPAIRVELADGSKIVADIVILSIGVRPETSLAKKAGLKIGKAGGIYVNEFLQTSQPYIYAVGDAIEFPHPVSGEPWLNYLAGPANRQGRIVADNMVFGNKIKYEGSIGTSIAKVFDMTVASTGLPGKKLKQLGIPYLTSTTHSNSHAGYYPNALQMSTKITFDPESGRLYGGQIVGYEGVDKRIDQLAQIVKRNGTVYDLISLEHAYAPPFSSAKDPVA